MKRIALLFLTITLCAVLSLCAYAYDYYGKVMPDYYFNPAEYVQSVSPGAVSRGLLYDAETDLVYSVFGTDIDATAPSDGAYVQFNFPEKVNAEDYPYIKFGYRAYTKNDTSEKQVDINVGIAGVRFWGNKPYMQFDGEYREAVIDATKLSGGEAYHGKENSGYEGVYSGDKFTYVRIKPWGSNSTKKITPDENDFIKIEYVAFFKTLEDADAYSTKRYDYLVDDSNVTFTVLNYGTALSHMDSYATGDSGSAYPYTRYTSSTAAGSNANEAAMIQYSTFHLKDFDIHKTPVLKVRYRSNFANSTTIDFNIGADYGPDHKGARIWGPKIAFIPDGTWRNLVLDLRTLNYTGGDSGYYAPENDESIWDLVNNVTFVRIKPYNRKLIAEGDYFDVMYYGFYSSVAEANSDDPSMPDNYSLRGDVNGDFKINTVDEIYMARELTDPGLVYDKLFDVNGDDFVNALDHAILARNIAGWKKYQSFYTSYAEDDYIEKLNEKFEQKRDAILNSESEWVLGPGGTVYYVSPNGDDLNDGKSPQSAWKSTANIKSSKLNYGDVVLFERGGIWRGNWTAVAGVTYSAYGTGKKPAFYGSIDAADPSVWEEVSENLYKYTPRTFSLQDADVGCIIFDHGEAYGARVLTQNGYVLQVGMNGITSNGIETWESRKYGLFTGESELNHDLEYYLNPQTNYLYLYSDKGNPGNRFDSIELSLKGNVIAGKSNCTFDNLTIKYGASHGIGMGTVENVTVRNCEVGWIGGAIQNLAAYGEGGRFGNGIEIFGGSRNFNVYNNYVYECFDCGITVQFQNDRNTNMNDGTTIVQINSLF
ncbi:MAG: right-handed parallel beta-helix repeat-containing protein, partial [Clostridia bacterium]|nr:right-handed parallel beta-helix repeat-containing protein [Clostridia bacterium]